MDVAIFFLGLLVIVAVSIIEELTISSIFSQTGQDWRAETAGGSLKLTDFMVTQFIVMNMFNKDITVEETSSGQIIDVQKSEMLQLARPTSGRKEAFKFKAILKDSSKKVLVNGQDPFSLDPSDITMMNILVVHEEGNEHICYAGESNQQPGYFN